MASSRSGAAVQAGGRPANYYSGSRPEVAALIPPECRRVLEVGCGTGGLGRLLKERGHHVTGLELVPEVAEEARRHLDRVETGDAEADGFPFPPGSFEAVIFADVLEHLIDPWCVLREAVTLLTSGGRVVASIPNLQHIDVVRRLLRGRWQYRERGITDRGHLRFFTLETIVRLYEQAGLTVAHVGHLYRRTFARELTCFLTGGRARAFYTRQYLVVGRKAG